MTLIPGRVNAMRNRLPLDMNARKTWPFWDVALSRNITNAQDRQAAAHNAFVIVDE
jgi:hypothetical protein